MIREIGRVDWWYWPASGVLLLVWAAGRSEAKWPLLALSLVQVVHYGRRHGDLAAFPVQVRLGYAAVVAAAIWEPTQTLRWLPTAGTWAQVLFGYCLLARALTLSPWNRQEPLSAALVWRTFASSPRPSVLPHAPSVP